MGTNRVHLLDTTNVWKENYRQRICKPFRVHSPRYIVANTARMWGEFRSAAAAAANPLFYIMVCKNTLAKTVLLVN